MKLIEKFNIQIDSKLVLQNKQIINSIDRINKVSNWKKYKYIFLNSLSILWDKLIWNIYSESSEILDISDFPWLKNLSNYWKDIYLYRNWYKFINSTNFIWKPELLNINNILVEKNHKEYLTQWKKITKNDKIIFTSEWWEKLENNLIEFIDLFNHWVYWEYSPTIAWYLNYLFLYIHPFWDGNWRLSRILTTYYYTHKLWCSLPCIFTNFFINNEKEKYYKLLWNIDRLEENAINEYCFWFNSWIIEQLKKIETSLYYINNYISNIKEKIGVKNNYISELYANIFYEIDYELCNNEIKNILDILSDLEILSYYNYNNHRIYYDKNFIDIIRKTFL